MMLIFSRRLHALHIAAAADTPLLHAGFAFAIAFATRCRC